jgi:DNA (cytosine-5)-methyltransferase 1
MEQLTVADIFAGLGGFSVGLERTGSFTTAVFCEQDPYRQQVLRKHWPDTPIIGDVHDVTGHNLRSIGVGRIDVLTAGFPCQPFSRAAGHRAKGIHDPRWLWPSVARLTGDLRPKYLIVENSPRLLTANKGEAFGEILGDLAEIGYAAEWHVLSASAFGAWHERERLWLIAYPSEDGLEEQEAIVTPPSHINRHVPPSERVGQAELHALVSGAQVTRRAGRWANEPGLCGVVDGLSDDVHRNRLEALGDSVVPIIPQHIGECIVAHRKSRVA